MISLELSSVRAKDADRAWLAQAVADFESKSKVLTVLPVEARNLDLETAFNGRTQGGKSIALCPSLEEKVSASAESMTITEAAKTFHLSQKHLERMAARGGFKFKRGYTTNPSYRDGDAIMVERICALRDVGLNRAQARNQIGMSYEKFHRLLSEYAINFPKVPMRQRNKKAKA
ncbi:MerR family transcriptional regulator [Pseudomonas eucalypticola]|uniref:MerR family transcriptional regulator n=1 Tax=Pseudomonas eucalypticola TaxID=2599595 RepID=A0A7D5H8S2_9PSED|nr:MerR family transcriptional regulator [Pseudomonas eucalypticola]QKZ05864.1 MerR family transcriptional regulator [Pseudomonas eucalypticola]